MNEDVLDFCDRCFNSIGGRGMIMCKGVDTEMNIPLVEFYHFECYDKLAPQQNTCTDCVDNPCFIRRKTLE
jgi:hypothetical protein